MRKNDLLCIDQNIRKESKTILLIDCKKTENIFSETWLIGCLKMNKISDKFISFIMNDMEIGGGLK